MLGINISAYLKVLLYIITACQTMVKFGNEVNPKVYYFTFMEPYLTKTKITRTLLFRLLCMSNYHINDAQIIT